MSSPDAPRKGFSALLGRIFGSESSSAPVNRDPEPARPLPKAPAPIVPPTPQVLTPRKGVGTVLRKAVQPGAAPHQEPGDLWKPAVEAEEQARPAKPASRLLSLPRTVLSMLRKTPPPQREIVFAQDPPAPTPTHDPALTRRKERDYPII